VIARTVALALFLVASVTIAANTTRAQSQDAWEVLYPHLEFGIDVGVMLWNGVDQNIVRPGGTVEARFGWNYKWWVPMFALGFRGNGLDLYKVQGAPPGTRRETLTNIFFSAGIRLVAPNRTRVAPQADLEVGFGAGYTFQGQFFLKNRSWLEPSISFTYSFPAGYENRTSIKGY
jgi:hypothetical protein